MTAGGWRAPCPDRRRSGAVLGAPESPRPRVPSGCPKAARSVQRWGGGPRLGGSQPTRRRRSHRLFRRPRLAAAGAIRVAAGSLANGGAPGALQARSFRAAVPAVSVAMGAKHHDRFLADSPPIPISGPRRAAESASLSAPTTRTGFGLVKSMAIALRFGSLRALFRLERLRNPFGYGPDVPRPLQVPGDVMARPRARATSRSILHHRLVVPYFTFSTTTTVMSRA